MKVNAMRLKQGQGKQPRKVIAASITLARDC